MSELYHHGILGQRWGTRNGPPYPLSVSSHSLSEKKAGWRESLKENRKKKKTAKKRAESLKKARKAKEEKVKAELKKEKFNEQKEKILKKGNATQVLRYKGQLTNQEMQDVLKRINWERTMSEISKKERPPTTVDFINKQMKNVDTLAGWMRTASNFRNEYNKLFNSENNKKDDRS